MRIVLGEGKGFKPIKLEVTLESEDEVGAFFAIFNHSDITDSVPCIDSDAIRDMVQKGHGGKIEYGGYHEKLTKTFKDRS